MFSYVWVDDLCCRERAVDRSSFPSSGDVFRRVGKPANIGYTMFKMRDEEGAWAWGVHVGCHGCTKKGVPGLDG